MTQKQFKEDRVYLTKDFQKDRVHHDREGTAIDGEAGAGAGWSRSHSHTERRE